MRVAGVSLEDSFLRISVVDRKFGIIKPFKSEDIRLPSSEQERAAVIKEAFQKIKEAYNPDGLAIGLELNIFSHHVIDMPLLSRTDMRSAFLYELEKYLPLQPEEYVYDFFDIEKMQNRAKTLVLSTRKDKINGLINIIRNSGLNLLAVKCSFLEAVNEFIAHERVEDAIFIYAAEEEYNIAVLKSQTPVLLKTILRGQDVLPEIERLVASAGSRIFVAGFPEQALLDKITAKTFSLSLANSIALSVLRKPGFETNFMPAEFLPEKKDYYPYTIGAMAAAAIALFFFTALLSYYKDYSALHDVESKSEQLKGKTSGFLETRKKIETAYEKRSFLYDFKERRNLNIRVITELSRILPRDTWLTSISIDEKGKVDLEGFAKRAAGIIEPLSKSKLFTKIEFSSPIMSQDNQEKFSIRMEIAG